MSLVLDELNNKILDEAEQILYEFGLYDSLMKFGNPHVSGSYLMKLMTWRDLDIYLEMDSIDTDTFFELGKEISTKLNPSKMSFRNELIGKTQHLPIGLYWGVHTNLFNQKWKIDIWAIDSETVNQKQSEVEGMKVKIDKSKRNIILELKNILHNHPLYRKTFFSIDIYDAVLNDEIISLEKFKEWLFKKKKIEI